MKTILALVIMVLLASCSCKQCQSQDLGPFANIGETLDATETKLFINVIRYVKRQSNGGEILGENILKSTINIDTLPSGTGEVDLVAAIQNRIFNVNNTNSLISRLCYEITYMEAVNNELKVPQWVRNVGVLSATNEIQNVENRRIFFDRIRSLEQKLPAKR